MRAVEERIARNLRLAVPAAVAVASVVALLPRRLGLRTVGAGFVVARALVRGPHVPRFVVAGPLVARAVVRGPAGLRLLGGSLLLLLRLLFVLVVRPRTVPVVVVAHRTCSRRQA